MSAHGPGPASENPVAPKRTLYLHEEILLLALRDQLGSMEWETWYQQAMGGSILAELLLRERIRVDDSKAKIVHALSAEPLGDPVIDECLARMDEEQKPRGAQHWVSSFAHVSDLR